MPRRYLRTLSLIVVATWLPFPIWYALSPEGFNVITNSAMMKVQLGDRSERAIRIEGRGCQEPVGLSDQEKGERCPLFIRRSLWRS